MKVKFWGVRGSIPSPIRGDTIRNKIKRILTLASPSDILDEDSVERFLRSLPFSLTHTYGGNTTCLEIRSKSNDLLIIDAGTGLRDLGNHLLAEGFASGKGECHFLFTHSHWDHIQGFPFFVPAYIEGNTFHIHAISDDFERRMRYQHNFEHFPVTFEGLQAKKVFHQHRPDETWQLYGINISAHPLRHPGGSWSYRLEEDGRVLIFASDAEFRVDQMENLDASLDYFRNADILIFDTQYTFEEQLQKIDWGHSSASIATDIAMKAGVKRLVLFHHDPSYSDEKLDEVYMRALRYREMMDVDGRNDLEIYIAYEGLELIV
jgi:phosphoribosyl 1,2-cyclic phosphodiesterase